eukprot:11606228-Alexandrium_andersonii.AAC.2
MAGGGCEAVNGWLPVLRRRPLNVRVVRPCSMTTGLSSKPSRNVLNLASTSLSLLMSFSGEQSRTM